MGVPVSDVDTLMAYAVCDGNGGEAHVDQQAHMAMSKLVEAENK